MSGGILSFDLIIETEKVSDISMKHARRADVYLGSTTVLSNSSNTQPASSLILKSWNPYLHLSGPRASASGSGYSTFVKYPAAMSRFQGSC